jgi:segregation and condensation protein B
LSTNSKNIRLVEALIFAAPEPVSADEISALIEGFKPEDSVEAAGILNREYEANGRAFQIISGAGGFRFATLPEFGPWVKRLVVGSSRLRLSRAALETVSVIAYQQPLTRGEIESVRGVDVGGVLRLLLERKLVKSVGRSTKPGKALLYGTTEEFLRYFGLAELEELPAPHELIGHVEPGFGQQTMGQENLELEENDVSAASKEQPTQNGNGE